MSIAHIIFLFKMYGKATCFKAHDNFVLNVATCLKWQHVLKADVSVKMATCFNAYHTLGLNVIFWYMQASAK